MIQKRDTPYLRKLKQNSYLSELKQNSEIMRIVRNKKVLDSPELMPKLNGAIRENGYNPVYRLAHDDMKKSDRNLTKLCLNRGDSPAAQKDIQKTYFYILKEIQKDSGLRKEIRILYMASEDPCFTDKEKKGFREDAYGKFSTFLRKALEKKKFFEEAHKVLEEIRGWLRKEAGQEK